MKILSFSLSNYRSFKEEQKIVFGSDEKNVTTIYGPNGAGKTNLFYAMNFFRNFVRTSTKFEGQTLRYEYFLLNTESKTLPTSFEAEFSTEKRQFKYRFSILKGKIIEEALGVKPIGAEGKYTTIFSRPTIPKGNYGEFYKSALKRTRSDALVLTKAWEDNNGDAIEVFEWLDLFKPTNVKFAPYAYETAKKVMGDNEFKGRVLDLLKAANLFIQDFEVSRAEMPKEFIEQLPFNDTFKKSISGDGFAVSTTHLLRNEAGDVVGIVPFTMENHESAGIRRIFELSYPILKTIDEGGILYIDEFENDLHPNECKFLVSLFEKNNPKKAQLIINTHSTILQNQVGRNNIRLLSKNAREESIISELPKSIKPDDAAIERKYNKGMLGAVPAIKE